MITARVKAPGRIQARADRLFLEKDPTVPAWAKEPEKPKYTAEEVGAQPKGDYITTPGDAAEGQVLKVAAVDESGKPTAWTTESLPTKDEIVGAVLAAIPVGDGVEY